MILSTPKLLPIKFHRCLLIILYHLFLPSYLETKTQQGVTLHDKLLKAARSVCKTAFDSWKKHNFPSGGVTHDTYRCTRKEYRLLLRNLLNNLESDKVKKLCNAAESNEKFSWKLLKGQRSTSQMSAFLVENKFITDKNLIREMWADHFEALGTPSVNENFDSSFLTCVTAGVAEIFKSCAENPSADLCAPLEYEEVASGTSGVLIEYEHISHAGPTLWRHLILLYQDFFQTHTVPENLKTGVILPLFKGKGAKANNKDNYRGITMFLTLYKVCEMIILSRLEAFAKQRDFFSEVQFGSQGGIGCIEASFVILETTICWNRGAKFSVAFWTFVKPSTLCRLTVCCTKLFTELGFGGRMWLAIKDLYASVKAQVLYSGFLSRQFSVSQGTGQGRILAPFMYKVYINELLIALSNYAYALNINSLSLPSPTFADDISLLHIQPSFLRVLIQMCYCYSLKWRYEFNNS